MDAEILSIGAEVVRGTIADANAAWLARELAALGIEPRFHGAVGDRLDDIAAAIQRAAERADLILVTGGLGPTADDITRQGIAAALNLPLERNAAAEAVIRDFLEARGRQMSESNLSQAFIPSGARALPNPLGTAPGFWAECREKSVIAMPGVPAEMERMFDSVRAELARRFGGETAVIEMQTHGMPESELGRRIGDLMRRGANPDVGTRVLEGGVSVRVIARGADAAERAESTAAEIERRLGEAVFARGDATLERALAALLERRGKTIAVAESCTGGLICALLTEIPGISRFFREGVVAYSNESKQRLLRVSEEMLREHGAVSAPVAEAMARGVRQSAPADIGVGVTGIAGPGGGALQKPVGLVYIAVADAAGCESRELRLGGNRRQVRARAARAALDLARRRLERATESGTERNR